jgi:cysteine desulfurase
VAETGAVQPIEEISRIVKKSHPNVIFHTDASQSVGKLENELLVSLSRSCDLITVAGHKFHAPKGVGALLIKDIIDIDPLLHGAGQEYGLRGGTENVAAIVGLGKACELSKVKPNPDFLESIKAGWNKFSNRLNSAGIDFRLNSTAPQRSPFTINFSVSGLDAPALVKSIGHAGGIRVCFSAGSACHSRGGPSPSKVLQVMGLDPRYSISGIRLSFGKLNDIEDVDEAFTILASHIIVAIKV